MLKLRETIGELEVTELEDDSKQIVIGEEGGKLVFGDLPDFSDYRYIAMEVTSLGEEQLELHLEFHETEDVVQSPTLTCTMAPVPYNKITLYFDFRYLDNQEIFLPRTPGKLKTLISGVAIPREKIKGLVIRIREHYKPQTFILHRIYLSNEEPDCTISNPWKLVDDLGQIAFRDWPGKTQNPEEMIERIKGLLEEAKDEGFPAKFPFSRYGGYKEIRLERTGFFRVEKDDNRWWLVDPDGYAFFSVGFDCIGTNSSGLTAGIEELYEWLPERGSEFEPAYTDGSPRFPGTFLDFYVVNMIKTFGDDWWNAWAAITKSHIYEWGFNTIGNWSQERFIEWARTPYVYPLADFPSTTHRIFRDFPDVFSNEFLENSRNYANQLKRFKGDPYLIGYFMRNEPIWGFAGRINLAREMFRSSFNFKSKGVLIEFLRGKYENNIQALNQAWDTALDSFEAILDMTYEQIEGQSENDLFVFSGEMVKKYISVPATELKSVDPNHLNLGMRYAWISSDLVFAGCEYFDVFSINCYKLEPDRDEIKYITERTGRPCMIGEYHFGSPDRGPIAAGLRTVSTQEERAKAYRYYTEQAASIKELLGVHYFTLNDEPTLGRGDGEAWQIGAVDVCQQVYTEFVDGIINAHQNMYQVAAGEQKAFDIKPVEIPRIAY